MRIGQKLGVSLFTIVMVSSTALALPASARNSDHAITTSHGDSCHSLNAASQNSEANAAGAAFAEGCIALGF